MPTRQESQDTFSGGCRLHRMQFDNTDFGIGRINLLFQVAADSIPQNPLYNLSHPRLLALFDTESFAVFRLCLHD